MSDPMSDFGFQQFIIKFEVLSTQIRIRKYINFPQRMLSFPNVLGPGFLINILNIFLVPIIYICNYSAKKGGYYRTWQYPQFRERNNLFKKNPPKQKLLENFFVIRILKFRVMKHCPKSRKLIASKCNQSK